MSNNQSTVICPDGFGPDLLYRFPTEPFFVEPYGMDCYFSYTGYTVIGAIIVASSAICLGLFLATLSSTDNKLIRVVKIVHLVTTANTAVTVAIGWTIPRLFHFLYLYTTVWFIGTALILAYMGYHSIAQTIRRVEMQVTVTYLVGGPVVTRVLMCIFSVAQLAITIGLIGVSATLATYSPVNGLSPFGEVFNRLLNIGLAAGTSTVIYAMHTILTRFIALINKSIVDAPRVAVEDGIGRSTATENMRDLAHRFRHGRNMLDVCAAVGISFCLLQGTIIPTFWFLALINLLDFNLGAFAVWFALTSSRKRGFFRFTGTSSHNGSNFNSGVVVMVPAITASVQPSSGTAKDES